MSDLLSLERWRSSREPALVTEGGAISFGAVADEGEALLRAAPSDGPLPFVAVPDLATLSLALAAISRGRALVPLHPKKTERDRARLVDEARARRAEPGALALLATSGSTGEPKLVELSRRAFIASATASLRNIPIGPGDRWLLAMPFAHAGGLSILTRCLHAGATVVVHRGFDAPRILASLARDRVSVLSVVPTMLAVLLAEDRLDVLRHARAILVGGAACPPGLLEECARRGIPALATYGLTETCSQVTVQPLGEPPLRSAGDSGFPLDGTTVTLVGDDGRAVASGVGRISVQGPTLMTRYLGQPPVDGAFLTEDLGRFDERGRLVVVGRADDMIISGGENVHPLEVEAAVSRFEGVAAVMVVGVPDPLWGARVGALVVLLEGARLGEVEEQAAGLSAHMRPRAWSVVSSLPTNAMGKPDRRLAARWLAEGRGSAS